MSIYEQLVNNELSWPTPLFDYDVKLIEEGKFLQKILNVNGLDSAGT